MKKSSILLFALCLIAICSCVDEESAKKSGFESASEIKNNQDVLNALNKAGITVYDGSTPPNIEGVYLTNECVFYDASSNVSWIVGTSPNSIFKLYNQSSGYIYFSEKSGEFYGSGSGAFITGYSNYFTIWLESDNSTGSTSILIISGAKLSNGNLDIDGITVYTIPDTGYETGDWWAYSGPLVLESNTIAVTPENLDVNYSNGCMELSWDYTDNAESYNIYRSTSSYSSYSFVGSTDYTSYSDCNDLESGVTYYYKVTSINSYGNESEMSDYDYASVPIELTAPTGVSVSFASGCMYISWNDVSNASYYNVYRSTSAYDSYSYISNTYSNYKYDCNSLAEGTTYYYKVTTVDSDGNESEFSDYGYATVPYTGGDDVYTDITFYNPIFTDIYITIGSETQIAEPDGSVTFYSVKGSSATFDAYTSGETTSGTQVGLKLSWSEYMYLDGTAKSYNLIVSGSYFFIYIKNTSSHDLSPLYVNYGLNSQTEDDIIIYNTGSTYSIGYYSAYTNSNVRAYYYDDPSWYAYWDQGDHFTLPFTNNQYVVLLCADKKNERKENKKGSMISRIVTSNKAGTQIQNVPVAKELNGRFNKDAINIYCK